jgi:hypothetical protein
MCTPSTNFRELIKEWEGMYTHWEVRNEYKIVVRKSEGERPLGRPLHRRMNNIKMDRGDKERECVDQN